MIATMNAHLSTRILKYAKPKRPYTASEASAVAGSSNTDQLHVVAKKIGDAVGLQVHSRDAFHDTPDSSVPSIAQAVYNSPNPETTRYAAAWNGLISQTPAQVVFHVGDGGDSVYKWHQKGSADAVRSGLQKHGIFSRILMPSGDGFDVMVYDPGRSLSKSVFSHSIENGTEVEESKGLGEIIGGPANGPTASSDSRSAYRKIISDYEGKNI